MLLRLFAFALLMLDGFSRSQPTVFNCSLIELNHRFNEWGQPCYSQIIVWEWNSKDNRHDVQAWWLVEPDNLDKLPQRANGRWKVIHTTNAGKQYRVVARAYRETRTQNDPERDNKLVKPECERTGIK